MKNIIKIIIIIILVSSIYTIKDDINSVLLKYASKVNPNSFAKNIDKNLQKETGLEKALILSDTKQTNLSGLVKNIENNLKPIDQKKLSIAGVLQYTNINRKENNNLQPLKENANLNRSAAIKLQDMFTNQYFEHESPKGVSVGDLAVKANYEYITIGENLALGNFKDNKNLVDAWMASPGHRANILNTKYTEIGIAVGYGTYKGQKTWLAVQHFGTPRNACPKIDNILSQTITIQQQDITKTSQELKDRLKMIDSGAVYEGLTTNEQIAVYNNLVKRYNQAIVDVKAKILIYNTSVKDFNACLEKNS